MKRKSGFRLLTKTTFIYLLFTFIAFYASALFLTREANEFIDNNLEHRFKRMERRIKWSIGADKLDKFQSSFIQITPVSEPPDRSFPVSTDTLIHNTDLDELQHFRKKTTLLEVDGAYYTITLLKSMDDFVRLRDDIFEGLIPAFIVLAVTIVLFNFLLSGVLFRPFNEILYQMKTFKIGQKDYKTVQTDTTEFKKMQDLFHSMIDRIQTDYRTLKEYTENMAHEIQTPLTIIRNKTETLLNSKTVMTANTNTVKTIYDEVTHLSRLGNTLNLITKIENGEYNKAIEIRTRLIIEKHVQAVEELAHLKSLTIETELSDDHSLTIDPVLLDIILKNLLRNAISYGSPEGPIHIKTTIKSLLIKNHGVPFTPSERELFERFSPQSKQNKSPGLGLALVKKICTVNHLSISHHYHNHEHVFEIRPVE